MAGRPKRHRASRLGLLGPREPFDGGSLADLDPRRHDPARMRSFTTAGGLRRVGLADALRFAQEAPPPSEDEIVEESASAVDQTDDEITDALYRHLHAGRADKASGLIQLLFLAGRSAAQIIDGSLRLALKRMGEDWNGHGGRDDWEHRAIEICIRILHELPDGAASTAVPMVAVGAALEGDPYVLPSMAAATVLESIGFDATNLGPDTSTDTIVRTMHEVQPALVWLSLTASLDPEQVRADVARVLEEADAIGATLLIGGRYAHDLQPLDHPRLLLGESMVELAAFATGLAHRAAHVRDSRQEPKRS